MNERILSPQLLELVQAAGPGYSQADPEWVKKFAQLIVRECAAMTRNLSPHGELAERAVKEHFGVEE